jgi:hypothetical protein
VILRISLAAPLRWLRRRSLHRRRLRVALNHGPSSRRRALLRGLPTEQIARVVLARVFRGAKARIVDLVSGRISGPN